MMDSAVALFDVVHTWLFENLVQPAMYVSGLMLYQEDAYTATEWVLLGALQMTVLYLVLRPMESLFPAEPWKDRRGLGVDVLYTLLHRLGGFSLLVFMVLTPVIQTATEELRAVGFTPLNLDAAWPGVTDIPWVSFLLYLVVLDFVDYFLHRLQHRLRWWWALHALHHSQQKMSFWSDDRNHVLDDLLIDGIKAALALVIGVEPGQFVILVMASRALESIQHANVPWTFGLLGRCVVSPVFHRRHHGIGFGHEGRAQGCNFAVLFPIWDILFRTADWNNAIEPTGIRDQLPDQGARDYGTGFWRQQWLGCKRLIGRY